MNLDVWVNSSLIEPVFIDLESMNFLDYWESANQGIPQVATYHDGIARADSSCVARSGSMFTATADSNANGRAGINTIATATAGSNVNAVGFASLNSPINHWVVTSQASPSYVIKINYFDYWISLNQSDPQTEITELPIVIVRNYVIMI